MGMVQSAILASKFYVMSSRKNKILAAYSDPLNSELVQQVEDYIDPEYRKFTSDQIDNTVSDDSAVDVKDVGSEGSSTSKSNSSGFSGTGSTPSSLPGLISEDEGEGLDIDDSDTKDADEGDGDVVSEKPDNETDEGMIEESTSITASTSTIDKLNTESMIILNSLNSVSETQGVDRISIKDSELWIYYNDKINLNSVMLPVIKSMNSLGYTYLEFSRLARSDNAIVFDISCNTSVDIAPNSEIE